MDTNKILFFISEEIRITMYPVNPIKETGIPKSVDSDPLVTASQFILLFTKQDSIAGFVK